MVESTIFESELYFDDNDYDTLLPEERCEDEMGLIDCNIYQYNNSIEQELEPVEIDDLLGVDWPHSENEEIHQDLLRDVIKINRIDNLTNNTETKKKDYTTDLIRGEDIEISIEGHNCTAHIDNGSGMTIMTLKIFEELKRKITKPMMYFRFDKPFSFQSSSDHAIKFVGYFKLLIRITGCEFDTLYHIVDRTNLGIVIGCDVMTKFCMKIDYARHTISVTPFLYTIYSISVPAESSVEVKALVERSHGDLPLITSPIKVFEDSPIEGIKCKKDMTPISGDTTKVTIKNDTEQGIVVPRRMPIGIGELATMWENVLQEMSEALELNRKQRISVLEGVTHNPGEYWEVINKIDLDHSKLSPKGREQLFDIIFKQWGAMSLHGEIGKLKNFCYKIKMSSDKVYNKESYHMNSITHTIMKGKIDELLDNNIAIKYMSEYSSPALLVWKPGSKNGKDPFKAKYRIVIDLREMNESAVHLQYSLPIIHQVVTQLDPSKNKFYSLLDISDAFYQVQLHEDLYPFVTFRVTNLGSFSLTRLPQGYVGGPSIFQAVIENLFPENIRTYLTYYIDDILIMTDTEEKHLEVIGIVLYTLRQNGMKLKIKKCNICPEQLDFLGVTLCKEGVKVKADKCEAIINIKTPQTKRQVRSFLEAIGYYRRYI